LTSVTQTFRHNFSEYSPFKFYTIYPALRTVQMPPEEAVE
jgi:hypothetical protein